MSGDFDQQIEGDECAVNVCRNAQGGDIVVFHDSEKAFKRLKIALPIVLAYFSKRGYRFEKLEAHLL